MHSKPPISIKFITNQLQSYNFFFIYKHLYYKYQTTIPQLSNNTNIRPTERATKIVKPQRKHRHSTQESIITTFIHKSKAYIRKNIVYICKNISYIEIYHKVKLFYTMDILFFLRSDTVLFMNPNIRINIHATNNQHLLHFFSA